MSIKTDSGTKNRDSARTVLLQN